LRLAVELLHPVLGGPHDLRLCTCLYVPEVFRQVYFGEIEHLELRCGESPAIRSFPAPPRVVLKALQLGAPLLVYNPGELAVEAAVSLRPLDAPDERPFFLAVGPAVVASPGRGHHGGFKVLLVAASGEEDLLGKVYRGGYRQRGRIEEGRRGVGLESRRN